jgi:hypothetical protein
MSAITNIQELNSAILLLENQMNQTEILLIDQYKLLRDRLRPVNLIKTTFKELFADRNFKKELLNTSIGIVSGYLSKKITIGATNNPLKKLLGGMLQLGVTTLVSRNGDEIRSQVQDMYKFVSKDRSKIEMN